MANEQNPFPKSTQRTQNEILQTSTDDTSAMLIIFSSAITDTNCDSKYDPIFIIFSRMKCQITESNIQINLN